MSTPLPPPTNPPLPLNQYKVVSFDVYGTLIEYKSHVLSSFKPLLSRLSPDSPYLNSTPSTTTIPGAVSLGSIEFLKTFQRHEDAIKLEGGDRSFCEILKEIWRRIADELGVETTDEETEEFGGSKNIASWPTFPGTVDALHKLARRYKLVALSNIDRSAWEITSSHHAKTREGGLGDVAWSKVFTAEDFGTNLKEADKEKLRTLLRYCQEELGVDRTQILHVAQSLGHDQAPAKDLGISSVWLVGDGPRFGKQDESRKALEKGVVGYMLQFQDLRGFAEYVDQHFDKQ